MIRIAICGDWAPERRKVSLDAFRVPAIVNLEGPILSDEDLVLIPPSPKAGPALSNRELPFTQGKTVFSLANNHIMDFGVAGLEKTLHALSNGASSGFFGAGQDCFQAEQPFFFYEQGLSIAILSRTERQFGQSSETNPGVAGLKFDINRQIADLKSKVNHVILLIHGGSEMVPFPSPSRRDQWRSYIDAGASAVIGNHVHVPSAWERYRHGIVFYGLGNFCVNPGKWGWHPQGLWGMVPTLSFDEHKVEIEILTTTIGIADDIISVRWAGDDALLKHLSHIEALNRVIDDNRLLESVWQETSMILFRKYYASWMGMRRAARAQEKVRNFVSAARSVVRSRSWRAAAAQRKDLLMFHLFACESHSDAISTALALSGGEIPDHRSEESAKLVQKFVHLD